MKSTLKWALIAMAVAIAPPIANAQQVTRLCVQGSTGNCVPVDSTAPLPVLGTITPAARTIVPLDVATVTTGGTAVTALTAGHRTEGGFILNPSGATINLCINEQAVASGTTSAAGLTCIEPGRAYVLTPAAGAVSVITSDSSHPFSGYGLN